MKNLISLLSDITQEWHNLYSVGYKLPIVFYEKDELLFLSGKPLCPIGSLILQSSTIEMDFISFYFKDLELILHIQWPEEGEPFIEGVALEHHQTHF